MNIERPDELRAHLNARGLIAEAENATLHTLEGGVSNRTVLLEREDGEAWVLKQALAKLRVTVDWFSSPERIHREAAGMRYLFEVAPEGSICPLIFEDHHEHVLAMRAVPQPHENWKDKLLRGELDLGHVAQFAVLLATIHREAARDNGVAAIFADRSFFEELRLEPYYLYAAEQVGEASGFLRELVSATRNRLYTLVHGDYSPKNVLIHNDRLILLDHEVIHFGDPAFDLGFALTHLLSKAHHLPAHHDAFVGAAVQFWLRYRETLGDAPFSGDLERYAVRHTLACLLARVAGRSPLEYLSSDEKACQKRVVLTLMRKEPAGIEALASAFSEGVRHVHD